MLFNALAPICSSNRSQPYRAQCLLRVCAVVRRRSSVGASPTRQLSLRPEAIGAVMEVTKWLKPLV